MTLNLHSVGFTHFLTEASRYGQQIRSTPSDVDKVIKFINDNQDWMSFLAQNPSENPEPVKMLSERLRQIGSAEGKEAADMIDQYLINARGMRQACAEVTIESNGNRPRFKALGFKSAEEVIKFLINSPEKDRIKYVNFKGLPLNNEQFEKLIKNCPNLHHIEIRKSLLSGDILKHLANLTNLQFLNISGCDQLEADALKHLAGQNNLQFLDISECDQFEADALKHLTKLMGLLSLNISGCYQLEEDALKHLANLKNLQSLTIRWCDQLERDILKYLANLKNLQSLDIAWCTQLESDALKHLVNLKKLQSLTIEGCTQLEKNSLKYLENLENLQFLDISDCDQLEVDDLKPLTNLKGLKSLDIGYCGRHKRDVLKLYRIYGYIITGEKLEMLFNKFRNEHVQSPTWVSRCSLI